MDPVLQDSHRIIATLANLFKREGFAREFQVLSQGKSLIETIGYDNWNGNTTIYGIFCRVPLEIFCRLFLEGGIVNNVFCRVLQLVGYAVRTRLQQTQSEGYLRTGLINTEFV